jgi:hypothetical protein
MVLSTRAKVELARLPMSDTAARQALVLNLLPGKVTEAKSE